MQVAQVWTPGASERASACLEEAQQAARRIKDRLSKARMLLSLAEAWLPLNREKAKKGLEEAYSAACRIKDKGPRSDTLGGIAGQFAALDPARAQKIWEEARKAAEQVEGSTYQAQARANLALERARWDPAGAVRDLEAINHPRVRLRALSQLLDETPVRDWTSLLGTVQAAAPSPEKTACLVRLLDKIPGQDERERQALWDSARKAAEQTGSPLDKVEYFVTLAKARGKQDRKPALALLSAAKAAAEKTKEAQRSQALVTVVQALTEWDLPAAAALARKVHAPEFQMEALNTVAVAFSKTDPAQARELLERSHKAARRLKTRPDWQAKRLGELAGVCETLDQEQALPIRREAVDAAIMIWNEANRAQAFCVIASAIQRPSP
jgi:hypothetical protein